MTLFELLAAAVKKVDARRIRVIPALHNLPNVTLDIPKGKSKDYAEWRQNSVPVQGLMSPNGDCATPLPLRSVPYLRRLFDP